jgi:hypothetical protein
MFETLKRLWLEGKLTEIKLNNAVLKGYITAEQKADIMSL